MRKYLVWFMVSGISVHDQSTGSEAEVLQQKDVGRKALHFMAAMKQKEEKSLNRRGWEQEVVPSVITHDPLPSVRHHL